MLVNPLQFSVSDHFGLYPHDDAVDLARLEAAGCNVVWLPAVGVMYPPDCATAVEVGGPAEDTERAARPGHFRGMTNGVTRLLHQAGPDLVLFGEGDWHQLQAVRRMVADLDWPVRAAAVPTLRDPDGLALSSRNRHLTPEQRSVAPRLHQVLQSVAGTGAGPAALAEGEARLRAMGMQPELPRPGRGRHDAPRCRTVRPGPARRVAAARLGTARLLDNVAVAP